MAAAEPPRGRAACSLLTRPLSIVLRRLDPDTLPASLPTSTTKLSCATSRLHTHTSTTTTISLPLPLLEVHPSHSPNKTSPSALISYSNSLPASTIREAPSNHLGVTLDEQNSNIASRAVKQTVSGGSGAPLITRSGPFFVQPRSPPKTRQSTVAARVRRQARQAGSTTDGTSRRVRLRHSGVALAGKKRMRMKRVASAAFLDRSEGSSDPDGTPRRGGGEEPPRRGRGRPPKKKRRLSSSADETSSSLSGLEKMAAEIGGDIQKVQETVKEMMVGAGAGVSAELEGGAVGGEEDWVSEEDDLAISRRLEELQRQREGPSATDTRREGHVVVETEVLPLTCCAPRETFYVYRAHDEGIEGVASCGGGGGRVCVHVADLEIDPSSIITDCEYVIELEKGGKRERINAIRETEGALGCTGRTARGNSRRPQFGVSRVKRRAPVRNLESLAAILPPTNPSPDKQRVHRPRSREREAGVAPRKRKRGRPRKSSSEPKRPRGRPRKKERGSRSGRKPGSLAVRRDSGSPPQGSPQNGEDSGYPGSISSSQGSKTLKSPPQDISPSYNFPPDPPTACTPATAASAIPPPAPPVLEQQCRGSINTAELGLFSPELMDDAHIANFPMPPDPQWVWPAMGIVGVGQGAESEGLLGNVLDSASETTTQSLFDPSKMVIAKVESLSEDSRFNDYLNEILESEEVMECLNSISAEHPPMLVDPPQIRPMETLVPAGPQVTVSAAGGAVPGDGRGSELISACSATSSSAAETTPRPTVVATCSGGADNGGLVQSSSETVAAYVAAETSVVPFSVGDCLGTTAATTTPKPEPPSGSKENQLGGGPGLVGVAPPVRRELAPKTSVMWSQSGSVDVPDTGQGAESISDLQRESSSGGVVSESVRASSHVLSRQPQQRQSTLQSPHVVSAATSGAGSIAMTTQPPREKKRIFRVKRNRARKTEIELSSNDGGVGQAVGSQKVEVEKGGCASREEEDQPGQPEVKSRTGRAIKPSWKVALSSSNQVLRRTTSPGAKVSARPSSGEGTQTGSTQTGKRDAVKRVRRERLRAMKTFTAKRSAATASPLSLATVGGAGVKKLPDIPATLCGPNPPISLPSTSSTLSMSLDDILQQMSEEEPQEAARALEFAESLLTTSTLDPSREGGSHDDLEEKGDIERHSVSETVPPQALSASSERKSEVRAGGGLGSAVGQPSKAPVGRATGGSSARELQLVVKLGRECPSPICWTEEDTLPPPSPRALRASRHKEDTEEAGVDPCRVESTSTDSFPANQPAVPGDHAHHTALFGDHTHQPAVPGDHAHHTALFGDHTHQPAVPGEGEDYQDLDGGGGMDADTQPPAKGEGGLPAKTEEEEDFRAVMMDLCTDSSDDEGETLSLAWPRTPSLPPEEEFGGPGNGGEGEVEEDKIEIFADDFDTFTVYTMEEKPKKNAPPPRMPSPPRIRSPKARTRLSVRSRLYNLPQSQRRLSTNSSYTASTPQRQSLPAPSIPPLFPSFSASSLPPPSSSTPHLDTPHLLSCPAPTGGSSGLNRAQCHGSSAAPQPLFPRLKPCWAFLRGSCTFTRCRFSHVPLRNYPAAHLESILLRLPQGMVPMDISEQYVTRATAPPQTWFPQLVKLVRGLTNRKWDAAVEAYSQLTGAGVLLRPALLSRLLDLTRELGQPMLGTCVSLVLGILQSIRDQGPCHIEHYHSTLKILESARKPVELVDVYMMVKADSHQVTLEILHLVLRGCSSTDERILELLKDSKTFLSSTTDIARIAKRVLEKVSVQLLSRNLQVVDEWLTRAGEVLDIVGQDTVLKLFNVLVSSQSWSSLLGVLERSPKIILGLDSRVCGPLSAMMVQQPTLSDRVAVVMEMMADEVLSAFSPEGWSVVLSQCTQPATAQRATKFCRVLSRSRKCLEREALDALLEMSVDKGQLSLAMEVLTAHLQSVPPVVPSLAVLAGLCTHLHQGGHHIDLCTVVEKLLQCRVAPSLPILQAFLDSCSREKAYGRLAGVVKRARGCDLRLEKLFYQRALVLLRPWGQDQAAISTIYKSLRTIDTESPSLPLPKSVSSGAVVSPSLQAQQAATDCGRSTPASQASRSSFVPTAPSSRSSDKSTKSLEHIYEKSNRPSPATQPGIIALLESNGRVGQFGAAVSILRNIRDSSSSTYSRAVVQAMWRAITNSNQKPANAFSSLLGKLVQPATASSETGASLSQCDRWLASQLGIALLKTYADTEQWQSGFVILHHLHRHKIDYFSRLKPFAPLPSLKPPHPSLFGLARTAVTTCLKVGSPDLAVGVLRESGWASQCGSGERQEREQLVVTVAERCLDSALYEDCYSCLLALEDPSTKNESFTWVARLYNRLLASVLGKSCPDVDLGNRVYLTMSTDNFPCLPSNFSLLLEKLCDLFQVSTAQDLCEQAIDQNFYSPITHGELFSVALPPSVHHVEVCSLVKRHLHRLSGELEGKVLQPLTINFEGARGSVEEALTKGLTPPLTPVFTSSAGSQAVATMSPTHLLCWLNAHFPSSHFLLEREKREQSCSGSRGEPSTAASSTEEKREDVAADVSAKDSSHSLPAKKTAQTAVELKQHFRVELCRSIVNEVKPFYQAGKFQSYEDYLHLVKVLTTHVCKSLKLKSGVSARWSVGEGSRGVVRELVQRVMSQCTVYSAHLQLGLSES